ncbi:MAG TPA: hypothetical protein VF941_24370, partial [Clostridia bacterium]
HFKKGSSRFKKYKRNRKNDELVFMVSKATVFYITIPVLIFNLIILSLLHFVFNASINFSLIMGSIFNISIFSYYSYYIGTFNFADTMPIWVEKYYKYVGYISMAIMFFCWLATVLSKCDI